MYQVLTLQRKPFAAPSIGYVHTDLSIPYNPNNPHGKPTLLPAPPIRNLLSPISTPELQLPVTSHILVMRIAPPLRLRPALAAAAPPPLPPPLLTISRVRYPWRRSRRSCRSMWRDSGPWWWVQGGGDVSVRGESDELDVWFWEN